MLTKYIEAFLLFVINWFTSVIAGARSEPKARTDQRSDGPLSRLFGGRTASASTMPPPPADPPVIIGEIVPSAREALRQPKAPRQDASFSTQERCKHCYITGISGAGKTTLLFNMLLADVAASRGVCFIDFRGENADTILAQLAARYSPAELADRLLLLDLRRAHNGGGQGKVDTYYTIGFDPLHQGRDPYSQVMFVMDVLKQQFGAALGVQTEELCRNTLLAMALSPSRPPLADIEIFLSSSSARAALLQDVTDSGVLRFFSRYDALPEAQRSQWVSPVMNKISPMLSLPALRRLLGDAQSISLQDFLDARPNAILLVSLAADEIYGVASLIGTLVISAVASALMRSDRKGGSPFFVYVDEFHNFAIASGDQFCTMISEARRFGLGLILSHQSTSQLEPKLRVLIRNVVSTHVLFSTGGVDAELLAGEVPSDEPKTVIKQVLLSQRPGEALLVRRGLPTARIKTYFTPDPVVAASAVQALRRAALRRHGRPAAEVEAELQSREARYLSQTLPKDPIDPINPMKQPRRQKAAVPLASAKPASSSQARSHYETQSYEVRDREEQYKSKEHGTKEQHGN